MNMKKAAFVTGVVLFVLLGVAGICAKFGAKPVLAAHSDAVLILDCSGPGQGVMSSFFFEASSNAPAVTATTCSQALADALNEGFKVQSTNGNGFANLYTLVRSE